MRFKAVLFDAGETLVHPVPSFPELFSKVLAREGHDREPAAVLASSATVFDRFSAAARDVELWTTSPARSRAFWTGVYERMLGQLGLPDGDGLRDALYETFTDLDNYALFPDVEPTLDALDAAGLTLGVVSNFEAWLDDLLAKLGVRERFPVLVISGLEGVEKPDPAIYRLALERTGVDAAETAFVGDNPVFDVAPAAALGMTPVLIDRRERFPEHDGLRVRDLRELPGTLAAS